MSQLIFNIFLAFGEGLALIVSPCILPILPIVLSGSLTGSKRRPMGIIFGFIISFIVLTLFAHHLVQLLPLSSVIIRYFAMLILLVLAIIMLSETLTEKFGILTANFANVGTSPRFSSNNEGFWGGAVFGTLIGILWTPCAGPILAAVIVQIAIQQTSFASILILLAFSVGVGVPMLVIAFFGRSVLHSLRLKPRALVWVRKILGLVILVSVILMLYMPAEEMPSDVSTQISSLNESAPQRLIDGLLLPYQAPELSSEPWINSPPLTLKDLKGKVVLIDFWTYSCINCIRTLPYLKAWYEKYHQDGLVIIGVHSPEFAFERDYKNVLAAVKKYGLNYPIVLDNDFRIWRAYNNRFWPAHYLINKDNQVVYEHFGEGNYDVTENNIRYLLGSKKTLAKTQASLNYDQDQTPEIYLGYSRADHYQGDLPLTPDIIQTFNFSDQLTKDYWGLKGRWLIQSEYIQSAEKGSTIRLHFNAANVYAVLGTLGEPKSVMIMIDNKEVKHFIVDKHDLYPIFKSSKPQTGILDLVAQDPGLQLYTFTFGD